MKDIFIDSNIAKSFSRPADEEYKNLIRWLLIHKHDTENDAYLLFSKKLEQEYVGSAQHAKSFTSIPYIIEILRRQERLREFSNNEIEDFLTTFVTKKVKRRLREIKKDWNHLPLVMLSDRKMAITIDDDFIYNLTHFPGFTVIAAKRPEELPYKD
jgi:hypothetical protein